MQNRTIYQKTSIDIAHSTVGELPNIKGTLVFRKMQGYDLYVAKSGAFVSVLNSGGSYYPSLQAANGTHESQTITFAASGSNPVYGDTNFVVPSAIYMQFIIRY